MTSARQQQTEKARAARWPGTFEKRREDRTDKIILYIARLGWATTALVNYYLGQTSQTWPKQLEDGGLLYRQRIVIGNQTKSRTQANGRIATILLLTDAGQRRARQLDSRLGKRIALPSLIQARHDLIANWAATKTYVDTWELREYEIEIFADQVLRTIVHDADVRPDAVILHTNESGKSWPKARIEVERSKKKTGLEEYKFLQKLEKYSIDKRCETIIVCETQGRADAIVELLERAQSRGLKSYYYNNEAGTWWEEDATERFKCRAIVALFNLDTQDFIWSHYHNTTPPYPPSVSYTEGESFLTDV
jgi:hypothetical protein